MTGKPTPFAVLFSLGFRPFFLLAGGYGALAVGAWTGWLGQAWPGADWLPAAVYPASQLHAHEMMFGFALAAIAGFLLTAAPQWTGGKPLRGPGLAILAGTWVLGRLAMLGGGAMGPMGAMALDMIFPLALCAVIGALLVGAKNRRNYGFIVILALAALANLCWHLEMSGLAPDFVDGIAESAPQLMLNLLLIMVAVMGGRVIPMFSANWLRRQGQTLPIRHPVWLQRLCLGGLALLTLSEFLTPHLDQLEPVARNLTGGLALLTGIAFLVRLWGWNGHQTWAHPLVWILHLAYFWLGLALLLKGGHYLDAGIPGAAARHAAAMGAVGTMIMAIMPRVSLGHTGRELILPRPMLAAYALIVAAPLLRVASPFLTGAWYQTSLLLSGLCWVLAFAIFIWCFAPMLWSPRTDAP
ncbi:MAG: NnrS family protein [Proteobacteria bacterium]|nr:NnrS family protein [Pseudomonadota bacterium]